MENVQLAAASIFQHHLAAFANNDLAEIMKDYTEHSELWTPEGEMVGIQAISSFFSYAFTLFPKGSTSLELKRMTAKGNKVYIVWTADSSVATVPFATDSSINDGKIVWQSTAAQIIQK